MTKPNKAPGALIAPLLPADKAVADIPFDELPTVEEARIYDANLNLRLKFDHTTTRVHKLQEERNDLKLRLENARCRSKDLYDEISRLQITNDRRNVLLERMHASLSKKIVQYLPRSIKFALTSCSGLRPEESLRDWLMRSDSLETTLSQLLLHLDGLDAEDDTSCIIAEQEYLRKLSSQRDLLEMRVKLAQASRDRGKEALTAVKHRAAAREAALERTNDRHEAISVSSQHSIGRKRATMEEEKLLGREKRLIDSKTTMLQRKKLFQIESAVKESRELRDDLREQRGILLMQSGPLSKRSQALMEGIMIQSRLMREWRDQTVAIRVEIDELLGNNNNNKSEHGPMEGLSKCRKLETHHPMNGEDARDARNERSATTVGPAQEIIDPPLCY